MLDSINAYLSAINGTYLQVSKDSPQVSAGTTPTTGGRVISDYVTLSPEAQAFLDSRGTVDPAQVDTLGDPRQSAYVQANFAGKSFAGGDLTGASLQFADLSGTNFSNAVLRDAVLRFSNVSGADFRGADLRGANLGGATGLTADQLIGARVDANTILPVGVVLE